MSQLIRLESASAPWDATEKYTRNRANGLVAIRQGSYKPFTGFPPDHHDGFSLRIFYSKDTAPRIFLLIDELNELSRGTKTPMFSGNHWRIHTTISDLRFNPKTTTYERDEMFEFVRNHELTRQARETLRLGGQIDFNTLWGGDNIVLAANPVPAFVVDAKEMMSEVAKLLGMGEKDMSGLVHAVVARAGIILSTSNLEQYAKGLEDLDGQILEHPIIARFSGVQTMSNQNMEYRHEKRLMLAAAA